MRTMHESILVVFYWNFVDIHQIRFLPIDLSYVHYALLTNKTNWSSFRFFSNFIYFHRRHSLIGTRLSILAYVLIHFESNLMILCQCTKHENYRKHAHSKYVDGATGIDESAHLHRVNTSTTFISTRRKTNIWWYNENNHPAQHKRILECDLWIQRIERKGEMEKYRHSLPFSLHVLI